MRNWTGKLFKTAITHYQPSDEKTSFGPLISQTQLERVVSYIDSGQDEGARLVIGGNRWAQSNGGYWVEPTILADTNPDMKVVKEEASRVYQPLTSTDD